MYFEISFKDIVNAIKKVIEDHPGATIATIASIVAGYLVYRALQPEPIPITGGKPKHQAHDFKQDGPLEGIEKSNEFSNNESEDEYREAVTDRADVIPQSDKETLYNCWSWAINPISHMIAECNPPGIPDNHSYTIEQMKTATCKYLNAMKECKKINNYSETSKEEDIINFIERTDIVTDKKLILGLRVIGGVSNIIPDGYDYHYIRWYLGQWTAKCGVSGIVVKNVGPYTSKIEPETMWAATLINEDPGRVRLLRVGDKNAVLKDPIYKDPTVYYLIDLP